MESLTNEAGGAIPATIIDAVQNMLKCLGQHADRSPAALMEVLSGCEQEFRRLRDGVQHKSHASALDELVMDACVGIIPTGFDGTAGQVGLGQQAVSTLLRVCSAMLSAVCMVRLVEALLKAPQTRLRPSTLAASHELLRLLREIAQDRRRLAHNLEYEAGVQVPSAIRQPRQVVLTGQAVFDPSLAKVSASDKDKVAILNNGKCAKSTSSPSVCMVRLGLPGAGGAGLSRATVDRASWEFSIDDNDAQTATCTGFGIRPIRDEGYDKSTDMWLVRSFNGARYVQGKEASDERDRSYKLKRNDIIRFEVDFTDADGVCRVYRNGTLCGTPFTGLSGLSSDIYPVVQYYTNAAQVSLVSLKVTLASDGDEADGTGDTGPLPGQRVGLRERTMLSLLRPHHSVLPPDCSLGRDGETGWKGAARGHEGAVVAGRARRLSIGMYPMAGKAGQSPHGGHEPSLQSFKAAVAGGQAKAAEVLSAIEARSKHAFADVSTAIWWLGGSFETFKGGVAICDLPVPDSTTDSTKGRSASGTSPVRFEVWGDEVRLWESGPVALTQCSPVPFVIDVQGVHVLRLVTRCEGGNANAPALWVEPCLLPCSDWWCGGWRNEASAKACALCGCPRKSVPGLPTPLSMGLAVETDAAGQPLQAQQQAPRPGADKAWAKRTADWSGTTHGLAHALLQYLLLSLREGRAVQRAIRLASSMCPARLASYMSDQAWDSWVVNVLAGGQEEEARLWTVMMGVRVDVQAPGSARFVAERVLPLLHHVDYAKSPRPWPGPLGLLATLVDAGKQPGGNNDDGGQPQPQRDNRGGVVEVEVPWPLDVRDGQGSAVQMDTLLLAIQLKATQEGCTASVFGAWPGRMHLLVSVPSRLGPVAFLTRVLAPSAAQAGLGSLAQELEPLGRPGQQASSPRANYDSTASVPFSLPIMDNLRACLQSCSTVPSSSDRVAWLAEGRPGLGTVGDGIVALVWYPLDTIASGNGRGSDAESRGSLGDVGAAGLGPETAQAVKSSTAHKPSESKLLHKLHKALASSIQEYLPADPLLDEQSQDGGPQASPTGGWPGQPGGTGATQDGLGLGSGLPPVPEMAL